MRLDERKTAQDSRKFQGSVTLSLGDDIADRFWQSGRSVLHSRETLLSMMQDLDRVMAA